MKRNIILLAVGALVALAAWTTIGRAQSKPAAGYTRLAVCDIATVFNKYQRAADLTTEFNGRKDKVKAEDDDKVKQMDTQAAMIKELTAGSKKYDEEMEKLQRMDIERQVWRKTQEQTVLRDYRLATEGMYNEICVAIGTTA
jgi:Skp family chaperone for outer membrane proteins